MASLTKEQPVLKKEGEAVVNFFKKEQEKTLDVCPASSMSKVLVIDIVTILEESKEAIVTNAGRFTQSLYMFSSGKNI